MARARAFTAREEAALIPFEQAWKPSLAGKKDSVIIAAVSQDGLYRMEAAIPWSLLNITPAAGGKFGFALRASDNDNPSKNEQQSMVSVIPGNVLADPTTWAELWLK